MTVQVKASFKKDNRHLDGLDAIRDQLVKQPHQARIIVAVVDVSKITENVEDGTTTPQVRFRSVEVMEGDAAIKATQLIEARYAERTGREDMAPSTLFDTEPDAVTAEAADPADAAATSGGDDPGGSASDADGTDDPPPSGRRSRR